MVLASDEDMNVIPVIVYVQLKPFDSVWGSYCYFFYAAC
jgi:hypothetical protein